MLTTVKRIAGMSRAELRFRAATAARVAFDRVRVAVAPPRWPTAGRDAHRAFAAVVASRSTPLPLAAPDLPARAALVRSRLPSAAAEAAARADRILDGRYDLLGYRDLAVGRPPTWHADPVHGRRAPMRFWADVPFLDPAIGDHKIIWELNRHQHWLALGRAYWLTGDRRYYDEFVSQLASWLDSNPPLVGPNWASMLELAFRSLSWVWALHFFAPAAADDEHDGFPWSIRLLNALDRQLTHVERNLSRYFSPNTHLTGEALALYVCGLAVPELPGRAGRIAVGRRVLVAEAARQVRADGGHAELSAHYHRYSTDFYLLALAVARAAGDPGAAALEDAARRQAAYLRTIADDRGRLPLLGDDDGGALFPICGREPADCRDTLATAAVLLEMPALAVGDAPEETLWFCGEAATRLAPSGESWPSRALPDSGYFVSRPRSGDHLVFDAGPHGYLNGGHAHADALSVVLTIQGRPLLIDGGTATYTMDPSLRDRFRSSAMHNTVVVEGRSQAEPDGPFHWRSAPGAQASICRFGQGWDYFEGRHTAYAPVTHVRQVLAVPDLGWLFVDHVLGTEPLNAQAFWHLHPDWHLGDRSPDGVWTAQLETLGVSLACSTPLTLDLEWSIHAPIYGRVSSAPCLVAPMPRNLPSSLLTFVTTRPDLAAGLAIRTLPVVHGPGAVWHTAAFEIRSGTAAATLLTAVERDGVPAGASAAPSDFWGTAGVRSDARVALAYPAGERPNTILINGTALHQRGGVASSVQGPATRAAVAR